MKPRNLLQILSVHNSHYSEIDEVVSEVSEHLSVSEYLFRNFENVITSSSELARGFQGRSGLLRPLRYLPGLKRETARKKAVDIIYPQAFASK